MQSSDESLRALLLQLTPSARDKLRAVLIRDDLDEIAQELLRYGDANGDGWADVIDTLSMYPDVGAGSAAARCRGVTSSSSRRTSSRGRAPEV